MRVGIACSGGGIRSACFSLGALSELWRQGVFARPATITAVSGGSYAAIGFLTTIATSEVPPEPGGNSIDGVAPWAIQSPEMRALRQRCDYLASGWVSRLALMLTAIRSALINLASAVLMTFFCAHVAAQVLQMVAHLPGPSVATPLSVLAAVTLVSIGEVAMRGTRLEPVADRLAGRTAQRWSVVLVASSWALVAIVALDAGLEFTHAAGNASSGRPLQVSGVFPPFASRAVVLPLGSLLTAVIAFWAVRVAMPRPWRRRARAVFAYLGVFLILGGPFVWAFEGVRRDGVALAFAAMSADVVLLLLFRVVFDANAYSLFPLYRARLRSSFFWRRTADGKVSQLLAETDDTDVDKRLSSMTVTKLHRLISDRDGGSYRVHPETRLVACAAVNLTDRSSRDGRQSESFALGAQCGSASTRLILGETFEKTALPSGEVLDLASVMAISGAAMSPTMGRFTRAGLGLILALLNLRLGVWIVNPTRMGEGASVSVSRPSVFHVLAEALGLLSGSARRLFLTDGGHYDNLGLVELLDHDCDVVISIDASLEAPGERSAFHYALGLLRSKGFDIAVDEPTASPDGTLSTPVTTGWLSTPDGSRVRMVHLRCDLYDDMSPDLRHFAGRTSAFPRHPTLQQFFNAELVDAYYLLGSDVARLARVDHIVAGGTSEFDAGVWRDRPVAMRRRTVDVDLS